MSIYTAPVYTPLTLPIPDLPPQSTTTRSQTFSLSTHSDYGQLERFREPSEDDRLSKIASESGTSARPLNELVKDVDALSERLYIHRRRFNRLASCLHWLYSTLLALDGSERQWATWLGRLDLFIRLVQRKTREWVQLGLVECVAWSDTILSDLRDMQGQAEHLGISKYSDILEQLSNRAAIEDALDISDLAKALVFLVESDSHRERAIKLRGSGADRLMNRLLVALEPISSPSHPEILYPDSFPPLATSLLHSMSIACLKLPSSLILPSITDRSSKPLASGRSFEVWGAERDGRALALKVLRLPLASLQNQQNQDAGIDLLRKLAHQTMLLLPTHIHHPHILQFIGTSTQFPSHPSSSGEDVELPALVTPWMVHGTVAEYLSSRPSVNRIKMLAEVAGALAYLHVKGVLHRSLRCENVLVNELGHTQLTGFSHALSISAASADIGIGDLSSLYSQTTLAIVREGIVRWTAPSVVFPSNASRRSLTDNGGGKEADVWSFGMLALELMTGSKPFYNVILDEAVAQDLVTMQGSAHIPRWERYNKPAWRRRGLGQELWNVLDRCWTTYGNGGLLGWGGEGDGMSDLAMTLERLGRDWDYGGRAAAEAGVEERFEDVPDTQSFGRPALPPKLSPRLVPVVIPRQTPVMQAQNLSFGGSPSGVPLPMSPAPSRFGWGLGGFEVDDRFGGVEGGLGVGGYGRPGMEGGTPSRVPLPLSPLMSERPISPASGIGPGGFIRPRSPAYGLNEVRSRSPFQARPTNPWRRSPQLNPTSPHVPIVPIPLSPAQRSRWAHTTTELRLSDEDSHFIAGPMGTGKSSIEEEFGVIIEMFSKDEVGGEWEGRNALWKVTGPESHVGRAVQDIMARARRVTSAIADTVIVDRGQWSLRGDMIQAAVDLLALSHDVQVEFSQPSQAHTSAESVVVFSGKGEGVFAASGELKKMLDFHARFNNAITFEVPSGLAAKVRQRGRGWLYEIGNSFNVDFEWNREGMVVIRGGLSTLDDAKRAFLSHFGQVNKSKKHETIRSHEVWHKFLRKNQSYILRSIGPEFVRMGVIIDSESGPVHGLHVSNPFIPTRPLPDEADIFGNDGTLWQLRPNKEEPGEGECLWRLVSDQDQHAELSSASEILKASVEAASHVGFLTLPESDRLRLDRLEESKIDALCLETGADIHIPRTEDLWHCTIVFIGSREALNLAKTRILAICHRLGMMSQNFI